MGKDPAQSGMQTKRLRISGIVQGVGYRAAFEDEARALRLSGWVRNRSDGSVEALVAGEAQALARVIAWCWRGPAAARVDQVAVCDAADEPLETGCFERRPTV